jgi:hypothetical protein
MEGSGREAIHPNSFRTGAARGRPQDRCRIGPAKLVRPVSPQEKVDCETSANLTPGYQMVTLPFDIFRVDGDGVRWLQSAATIAEAKAHIAKAGAAAGEYLLVNQVTGTKMVLKIDSPEGPGE